MASNSGWEDVPVDQAWEDVPVQVPRQSQGKMGFRPKVDNPAGYLGGASRALDVGGGLVRTGLAGVADIPNMLSGGTPRVGPESVALALQGKAPTTSEYLGKFGMEDGITRGLLGFAGDVVTDPLALLNQAKPVGALAEKAGKGIYKSGFKKIDERLAEKGKKAISDIALERGLTGTTKKIKEGLQKYSDELLSKRGEIYKAADEAGIHVNLDNVVKEADEVIAQMRLDPGLADQADDLASFVDKYRDLKQAPLSHASDMKSNLYDALPQSAWSPYGMKGGANKVRKSLSKGFREGIEDSAELGLGRGDEIKNINTNLSSILESRKPVDMQIRRGETSNLLTSMDAMTGGGVAALANPIAAAGTLGAKKLADLSKTTWARTNLGMGLIKAAEKGLLDAPAQRGLINLLREDEEMMAPIPEERKPRSPYEPLYPRIRPLGES
jgi:hypothetical protein